MSRPRFHRFELRRNTMSLVLGLVFLLAPYLDRTYVWARDNRPNEVFVAAASNLRFALDALRIQYLEATGVSIKISYGSSGDLVRQIQHGAPFEIFLSADESFAQRLIAQTDANPPAIRYASGRIGFFVPPTSRLGAVEDLDQIISILAQSDNDAIAIANPEHAPYGRAARECLQKLGLWSKLEGHLIIGENATQASQFAASGQITGGVIPYSLVARSPLAARGRFFLLPNTCHRPLHQTMVLTNKADEESRVFFAFLSSQVARDTMKMYGFDDPEQAE